MVNKILSNEDGNLNSATTRIVAARNRVYRDIDLSFTAKPNGELYVKRDAAAVKQAVKNLLLTNYFEKPFQPFFGGNLRDLLFDLADPTVEADVYDRVVDAIETYEPRASINYVEVIAKPDSNSISVTVEFRIVNTEETVTFTTVLSRLR